MRAVTRPAGAAARASDVMYLRVHASRVTTAPVGRQVASDGVIVQLARSGSRRPADTLLCC